MHELNELYKALSLVLQVFRQSHAQYDEVQEESVCPSQVPLPSPNLEVQTTTFL